MLKTAILEPRRSVESAALLESKKDPRVGFPPRLWDTDQDLPPNQVNQYAIQAGCGAGLKKVSQSAFATELPVAHPRERAIVMSLVAKWDTKTARDQLCERLSAGMLTFVAPLTIVCMVNVFSKMMKVVFLFFLSLDPE